MENDCIIYDLGGSLEFFFLLFGGLFCFGGGIFFFQFVFYRLLISPILVACLYLPCTVLFEVLSCFLVTGSRMLHVNPHRAKR